MENLRTLGWFFCYINDITWRTNDGTWPLIILLLPTGVYYYTKACNIDLITLVDIPILM